MADPAIPRSGYSRAARTVDGAFVQIVEDIVGLLPNAVAFQYFPETLTYALDPWDPTAVSQSDRGAQAPTTQPFDVPQRFTGFALALDATDGMAAGDGVAATLGVEPQIAALKKMTQASAGLLGDLTASFRDLIGLPGQAAHRPSVAPIFLVLGARIVLPVRFTRFVVEERMLSPTLQPIHARVTLDMTVLTPDQFRGTPGPVAALAIAAYEATRLREDASAVLNLSTLPGTLAAALPL